QRHRQRSDTAIGTVGALDWSGVPTTVYRETHARARDARRTAPRAHAQLTFSTGTMTSVNGMIKPLTNKGFGFIAIFARHHRSRIGARVWTVSSGRLDVRHVSGRSLIHFWLHVD